MPLNFCGLLRELEEMNIIYFSALFSVSACLVSLKPGDDVAVCPIGGESVTFECNVTGLSYAHIHWRITANNKFRDIFLNRGTALKENQNTGHDGIVVKLTIADNYLLSSTVTINTTSLYRSEVRVVCHGLSRTIRQTRKFQNDIKWNWKE